MLSPHQAGQAARSQVLAQPRATKARHRTPTKYSTFAEEILLDTSFTASLVKRPRHGHRIGSRCKSLHWRLWGFTSALLVPDLLSERPANTQAMPPIPEQTHLNPRTGTEDSDPAGAAPHLPKKAPPPARQGPRLGGWERVPCGAIPCCALVLRVSAFGDTICFQSRTDRSGMGLGTDRSKPPTRDIWT